MKEGQKLGKYEIHSILGEGGMGIVYKAYDPHLARVVAIKTIRVSLLEGKSGQDLRERFRREARAEGRLLHPNIITVYEYQEDEQGTPFFVMEYVEGKDLKQYLSRGILFNLEKSLHIIEQVLAALDHSHREGIVHRDIKPANIILLENDTVKIADFGIARMEESEFTQTGIVMGTPQYISPEQRLGSRVDARADVYSTGAVMYELLTGEKASPGLTETTLWHKVTDGELTGLDNGDAKTRRMCKLVVFKALAKDADDRFASAQEFLHAIEQARPTPPEPPRRRHLGLWLGMILGVVVLGASWYFSMPGGEAELSSTGEPSTAVEVESSARIAPLSAGESSKLQSQLKVANIHMLVDRLIAPQGSNAFHSFQLALNIDPANAEAQKGMASIKNKLVERVEKSIKHGNMQLAQSQLSQALQKFPDAPELLALRGKVQ